VTWRGWYLLGAALFYVGLYGWLWAARGGSDAVRPSAGSIPLSRTKGAQMDEHEYTLDQAFEVIERFAIVDLSQSELVAFVEENPEAWDELRQALRVILQAARVHLEEAMPA